MSKWEPREADGEMADRIRGEFQTIMLHLGPDAPSQDTEVEPYVSTDDEIYFWTAAAGYALAGHTVAYTDGFRGLVRASIGVFVPFALLRRKVCRGRATLGG